MKAILLTTALLVGCVQTQAREARLMCDYGDLYHGTPIKEDVCYGIRDLSVEIANLKRDIKALKHEATGVETGCRLERTIRTTMRVCQGECPPINLDDYKMIKTICKGDQKTVDSYNSYMPVVKTRKAGCRTARPPYGACFGGLWDEYKACGGRSLTGSGCSILEGTREQEILVRPWCFVDQCERLHKEDPIRYQPWG